jgi:hypothetical protein
MSKATMSAPDQITLTLAQRYLNILSESDLSEVYDSSPAVSGLFLSGLPTSFGSAKHRIMVVGMETKAWRNKSCPFRRGDIPTIDAVVESMSVHRECLEGAPGRHKFLQFLKHVVKAISSRISSSEATVVWANLFCVSHAGGTPTRSPAFEYIRTLSARLLRAQIEVVDPDVIFFTTGAAYDSFLKSCFPDRTNSRSVEPRCLWEFRLGRAWCYRTSHPRYVAHNRWRHQALDLAALHLGQDATDV